MGAQDSADPPDGGPQRRASTGRWRTAIVLGAAIAFTGLCGGAPASPADPCSAPFGEPARTPTASAVVMFPRPQHFAVLATADGAAWHLYAIGEIIPDARRTGQGYRVEDISGVSLRLRHTLTGTPSRVAIGSVVPDTAGRVLQWTVALEGVEYRYIADTAAQTCEPRLIAIREACAHLEVIISELHHRSTESPAAPRPGTGRVGGAGWDMVLTSTGANSYEMRAADVQAAMAHGSDLLMQALTSARPTFSLEEGIGLSVRSPVASGVFGPHGFRVDSPNLAQRAGIEIGDVIVAVNGQAITGVSDLFRIYQWARTDRNIATMSVDVLREGQVATKTFRIR